LLEIPKNFKCENINIFGNNTISKIPETLKCKMLVIHGNNTIVKIPKNFKCKILKIKNNLQINENLTFHILNFKIFKYKSNNIIYKYSKNDNVFTRYNYLLESSSK
jgi:hypothetical protein